MKQCAVALIFVAMIVNPAGSQTPEQKPSFEVASVKLNKTRSIPSRTINAGGLI